MFYPYLNVIVNVNLLPGFITVVKPSTTCTLNNLAPCFIRIEPYTTFKMKLVLTRKILGIDKGSFLSP